MKRRFSVPTFTVATALSLQLFCLAADSTRQSSTIILDEVSVRNLRIETVEVGEVDFERTVFAIGRIEEIPANRSVLSSRIPGRAIRVHAFVGDQVQKGDVLVEVESRQPGNPPPTVFLSARQSGLIVESHVRLGQPVQPDTELLDISDRSEMWAVAKIPEKEAAAAEIGTKARIHVPAIGGDPIVASLKRYGVAADRAGGSVDGIFRVLNPDGKLQPGMRVEFSIVTSSRSDILAVPRSAIQGDPTDRVVYVRDFELPNAFVCVPVQLGEQNDRYVEIVRGLFPGDEVVTQGSYSLGFAGSGSGISLKEALDAAHGHEHNEDGSEITEGSRSTVEDSSDDGDHYDEGGSSNHSLKIYSIVVTLLCIVLLQQIWRNRKSTG